jgi:acetyl-CoA carboxylase biotin carboxyl carrier protein
MTKARPSGRLFEPEIEALVRTTDAGIELRAPAVGLWRPSLAGTVVVPGSIIGVLDVLGVLHRVVVPAGAAGVASELERPLGEIPLAYGDLMLLLDPDTAVAGRSEATASTTQTDAGEGGLVFASPLSGRFYARPAPDKPPFVTPGDVVSTGTTVGLLEVMKTFNRITYGGSGLPDRARVIEVVPEDEADLDSGDVLLRIQPA